MTRRSLRTPVYRHLCITALLAPVLVACGGGGDKQPAAPLCVVSNVTVSPGSASLVTGATVSLAASVTQQNCGTLTVAWSSSSAAVASVGTDGTVSALTPGVTTITATVNGQSGNAAVTVISAVASVTLTPDTATIMQGATLQLTGLPRDAAGTTLNGRTVTYGTSSAAIASVSTTGLVTGIGAGVATITATSEGRSATSRVVVEGPVETIQLSPETFHFTIGGNLTLTAFTRDAAGRFVQRPVTWASANTTIAAVSTSGLVTGVNPGGPVAITGTSEGKSASMMVTIDPVVASITVITNGGALGVADTRGFFALVRRADSTQVTHRPVTWSVSDTTLATISTIGLLTPRRTGTVTVRATSDGVVGTLTQSIVVATTDKRIAWALVPNNASGAALQGSALNATGGAIRATRTGPGDTRIVFERMARLNASYVDVVMLSLLEGGGSATFCHVNSSQNASNGEDLEVLTSCYTTDGSKSDAYFFVLVAGGGALAGRHSFTTTTTAAASHTPGPAQSYNSAGATNTIVRNGVGHFTAAFNNARVNGVPENYFVTTVGANTGTCYDDGWNQGMSINVACDNASASADARYSVLQLEAGRPGERFAFAWSSDAAPPLGTDFTPSLGFMRTSSGRPIVLQRIGSGRYQLTIPNLAPGLRFAHVQITPYQSPRVYCKASTPLAASNGVDATITVSCAGRYSHAPTDAVFTILVID